MGDGRNQRSKRTLEIAEIIQLYKDGLSTTEIGKMANVSSRYVRKLLADHNIEKRPFGSWVRKYEVNEHYFKNWSADMAYILGFFAADGFISTNNQMISFAQKEKEILEEIRKTLHSNHPLIQNPRTGVYALNIGSKIMKDDLMQLHGMTPNKSLDLQFPHVPEEFVHHFIRGYFDGDGTIYSRGYLVSFVGGSLSFMNSLKKIFEQNNYNPNLVKKENHFRLFISGRRTVKHFYNWIYHDKSLYLKRKYNAFPDQDEDIENLNNAKLKRTKHAVENRKKLFIDEFAKNHSIQQACKLCGIKKATYYRWLEKDVQFRNNMMKLKGS